MKPDLTINFLSEQHLTLRKSVTRISNETGYCRLTIFKRLRDFGIDIQSYGPGKRQDYSDVLTPEFFRDEHLAKGKSINQIARENNITPKTLKRWLDFHGLNYVSGVYPDRAGTKHPGWRGVGELPSSIFTRTMHNARNRNLDFDLTIEFMWELYEAQDRKCALSGRSIGFKSSYPHKASLDRKDSTKGYVADNVWWLDADVNYAKQSLGVDQFRSLCRDVASHRT